MKNEKRVFVVGAGPGDPELMTLKGRRLLSQAGVVYYAGSLVPDSLLAFATQARHVHTASLTLDEIVDGMVRDAEQNAVVVRLHSGDPSIYGATHEQIRALRARGVSVEIVPGVPSFAAAAAALGVELTLPETVQSVVLTRTNTRASAMPEGENLVAFARTGATLAVHLSVANLARVVRELIPVLGESCPAAVVYRVGWPDELLLRGTLSTIRAQTKQAGITRTALIMVGKALAKDAQSDGEARSRLYHEDHRHLFRP